MARRSRRRSSPTPTAGRDYVGYRYAGVPPPLSPVLRSSYGADISELLSEFAPEAPGWTGFLPPPALPAPRVVPAAKAALPWRRSKYSALRELAMRAPSRTRFCIQRKARRQVLFALRRAGYAGSAKARTWRRTSNSQYAC